MVRVEPIIWVGGVVIIQTTLLMILLIFINNTLKDILEKMGG